MRLSFGNFKISSVDTKIAFYILRYQVIKKIRGKLFDAGNTKPVVAAYLCPAVDVFSQTR